MEINSVKVSVVWLAILGVVVLFLLQNKDNALSSLKKEHQIILSEKTTEIASLRRAKKITIVEKKADGSERTEIVEESEESVVSKETAKESKDIMKETREFARTTVFASLGLDRTKGGGIIREVGYGIGVGAGFLGGGPNLIISYSF